MAATRLDKSGGLPGRNRDAQTAKARPLQKSLVSNLFRRCFSCSASGRCGRGRLRAFWRCGGRGLRGGGSRRWGGGGGGVGGEAWTGSLDRRRGRGGRRGLRREAGRARPPWWRANDRGIWRCGG